MRVKTFALWGLATAIIAASVPAFAIQDDAPLVHPKQSPPKPAGATLLVICDLACNWKLDGDPKGSLAADGSKKVTVPLGQHIVEAATQDGLDRAEKEIEIKTAAQAIARLELAPIRDARLQGLRDQAAEDFKQGKALYDQKRYDEARPLLQKACDGGNMAGCAYFGGLYHNGWGVTQDYTQARTQYEKACDGGNMRGCGDLGTLYMNGEGVAQDYAQARTLLQKGCDSGEAWACSPLGALYEYGRGVTQDQALARTLYQKSCDGGYFGGCNILGSRYQNGQGVTQDYTQARTLYQKACDGGNMGGCFNLGWLYQGGDGVTQDLAQARALFQKACDGGGAIGCNELGRLYQNGQGVTQDYAQARTLYQKACDGGYSDACTSPHTPPAEQQPAKYEAVWTDPATGLMWAKKDNGSDVNWQQASDYCKNLQLAGYFNWRLATIDELQRIYDSNVTAGSWHVRGNLQLSGWEWSGSQENASGRAWYLQFDGGWQTSGHLGESTNTRALCARRPGE